MNSSDFGTALTSAKVSISNKAIYIPKGIYEYKEEEFGFINGGYTPLEIGDVARGIKSGATAIIIGITINSGEWEKSDVIGIVRIKSRVGDFIDGESISVGAEADRINIVGIVEECEDDYDFKGAKARSVYISVPPSKDSLVDHSAVVIAVSGNKLDYNYTLGVTIPEGKKWILYNDEIKKANFISFVQGTKSIIDVIGYFR